MPASPAEMAQMIFKQSLPDGFFEFKCTTHMLKILVALDGSSNLAAIVQKTGLPQKGAEEALLQLLQLKLVTTARGNGVFLDESFLEFLKTQPSAAVGPIAEFLAEDAAKDLGHDILSFPAVKAADLVMALAKDIQREDKKLIFKQQMIARIKKG